MEIVVISDSHGENSKIENVMDQRPNAEIIIHLGDSYINNYFMETKYKNKKIFMVKGNCDTNSPYPLSQEFTIASKKFFITHGHIYSVKLGLNKIYEYASYRNIDVVLFGHTHKEYLDFKGPLYVMNPGSLKGSNPSYGLIEIEEDKIYGKIIPV